MALRAGIPAPEVMALFLFTEIIEKKFRRAFV